MMMYRLEMFFWGCVMILLVVFAIPSCSDSINDEENQFQSLVATAAERAVPKMSYNARAVKLLQDLPMEKLFRNHKLSRYLCSTFVKWNGW